MQLIYAAASPFARKVRVLAAETGLLDRIELLDTAETVRRWPQFRLPDGTLHHFGPGGGPTAALTLRTAQALGYVTEEEDALLSRFGYAFVQPPDSNYPPICDLRSIKGAFISHRPAIACAGGRTG